MVVARAVLGDSSCDSWRQAVSSYTVATRETRPEGPRSLTHVTLIPQISRDAPSKQVVPSESLGLSAALILGLHCSRLHSFTAFICRRRSRTHAYAQDDLAVAPVHLRDT